VANHPDQPALGTRRVPFAREIYIERDDFMDDPPKKFFRLAPGREVRLRNAYLVTCTGVIKNASGEIVELRGTYDPATRGGDAPDGRKVKATLHWVSAAHAVDAEVRLYDRLFTTDDPEGDAAKAGTDLAAMLNPHSLDVMTGSKVEPQLGSAAAGARYQFERQGYFCADPDTRPGAPVFNRTVSLKDRYSQQSTGGS
jgi:glutaminyl-tRNA synthetase